MRLIDADHLKEILSDMGFKQITNIVDSESILVDEPTFAEAYKWMEMEFYKICMFQLVWGKDQFPKEQR